VLATWRTVDAVIGERALALPLFTYAPDTWGPGEARLIPDGWHNPVGDAACP